MESNDRDEHQSPSIKLRRGGSDVTSLVNGRWVISAAVTVFLFIAATLLAVSSSLSMNPISASFYTFVSATRASFAAPPTPPPGADVPRLAYLISGSKGDLDRLWRVLHALYHPRNLYVVHLDLESSVEDRLELVARVDNSTVFQRVGNVDVIRRSNMVTYRGPTMVANTLHACALLLHRSREWDWFINLSASDYPLMTQDGMYTVQCMQTRSLQIVRYSTLNIHRMFNESKYILAYSNVPGMMCNNALLYNTCRKSTCRLKLVY
jgi:protein xylosyltransferase